METKKKKNKTKLLAIAIIIAILYFYNHDTDTDKPYIDVVDECLGMKKECDGRLIEIIEHELQEPIKRRNK